MREGNAAPNGFKLKEVRFLVQTNPQPTKSEEFVVDRSKTSLSDLWKLEDYWAIWLGVLVLIIGLFIYMPNQPADMEAKIAKAKATMQAEAERAPFKTVAWYQANDSLGKLKASDEELAKKLGAYLVKPHDWKDKPLASFYLSGDDARAKSEAAKPKYEEAKKKTAEAEAAAKEAEAAAAAAQFKDAALNDQAVAKIADWRKAREAESKAKKAAETKPYNLLGKLIILCVALGLFFSIGTKAMGRSVKQFLIGFPFVFVVATIGYFLAGQSTIKAWGFEYVLWAVLLGMLISNTIGTPKWVMPAVQTEYYIKTGLVLLGASILFGKIAIIGLPGIFQTWVATPLVLIVTYWFGQRILKMKSKTLNIVLSADMSVSGVSAAIATAAACRAKKEELTLAVGISIIFTAVMMFAEPLVIKAVGMHDVLAGAWMGGTIDSTGAVVAAGALVSNTAMYVAATIKMIQNILIGITAFCVAAYWCLVVDRSRAAEVDLSFKGAMKEVWRRFPKFVIGFIGASIAFSLLYQYLGHDVGKVMLDEGLIKGWSSQLQGWFFALAFASIGLGTNFREVGHHLRDGKPVVLYVVGQTLQFAVTLGMAYLMFFQVFPEVTAKLMGK